MTSPHQLYHLFLNTFTAKLRGMRKLSRTNHQFTVLLIALSTFAVAMGYIEAAVVAYLRELYYPEGFAFPLKMMAEFIMLVEVGRELATLVLLTSISFAVAKKRWERFGWFLFLFGAWDVWYYIWLKLTIGWPLRLTDWDVLFLIPIPWIGPVIAPLSVALSMIIIGPCIVSEDSMPRSYRPGLLAWVLGLFGSAILLYSFMSDTDAILHQQQPQAYSYWLLMITLASYWTGFLMSLRRSRRIAGETNN